MNCASEYAAVERIRRARRPALVLFAADENFNGDVLRGIRRRRPELKIARVQDAGLSGASDPEVLDWAAREGRVLMSHDVSTLAGFAYRRVEAGLPMPGALVVSGQLPIGEAVDLVLLVIECTFDNEWSGQVRHLPL